MDIDLTNSLITENDADGNQIGQLHFTFLENKKVLSIDQIFVNPQFRNQGWADKLLQAGIDLAKDHDCLILPVCPYARTVFKKEKTLQPLLAINGEL